MKKHESYELKQYQSLSLDSKIRMSQQRIKSWYEYYDGKVYVSRSGGKDSDVLGHIVSQMYPDVPHIYIKNGLDNCSVRNHGISIADEVLRPMLSHYEVILKYGYPVIGKEVAQAVNECQKAKEKGKPLPQYRLEKFEGKKLDKNGEKSSYNMDQYAYLLDAPFRISSKCCYYMKKVPAFKYEKETGRKPYLGTLAEESRLRKSKWMQYGCNAFEESRPTSQPLSFWTEQDILQYIKIYHLDIASIYGNIVYVGKDGYEYPEIMFDSGDYKLTTSNAKRTGCVFCLFGITQDTKRFLRLKETEPEVYDYVMRGGKWDENGMWVPHKGLGYKFIINWLNEHGKLNIEY